MHVTVGYIFQTAAGLAQVVERLAVERGGLELVSHGQKNTQGLKIPGKWREFIALQTARPYKVAQMTT